MSLRGIPDRLWPVHPDLLEGELLSSWMLRTAHGNGYQAETMCSMLFGTRSAVWNRDIDRSATTSMVNLLAQFGGRDPAAVEEATLRSLRGTISEEVLQNGASTGIIPLGIYHRRRRRNGLMFCAGCLKTDAIPYFRKVWRLTYITACPDHGCQLLDACQVCGAELAPHRVDMQWSPQRSSATNLLTRCHRCFANLADANQAPAGVGEMGIARGVSGALQRGWVNTSSTGCEEWVHGVAYFTGLQALARGLHQIKARSGATWSSVKGAPRATRWQGLDRHDLPGRRRILESIGLLINDWPRSFLEIARAENLIYTDLCAAGKQLPMWIDRVGRTELMRVQQRLSSAQMTSIACATKNLDGRFSVSGARKLSGCSLDHARLGDHWIPTVEEKVFDTFQHRLDGAIAGASGLRKLSLMQDKVVFAVAWEFGQTQVELSNLDMESVAALLGPRIKKRKELDGLTPMSLDRVSDAMDWYLRELRPQLVISQAETAVFLSPYTRARLSASAIGERFRQLRVLLSMQQEIPDYDALIRKGVISRASIR